MWYNNFPVAFLPIPSLSSWFHLLLFACNRQMLWFILSTHYLFYRLSCHPFLFSVKRLLIVIFNPFTSTDVILTKIRYSIITIADDLIYFTGNVSVYGWTGNRILKIIVSFYTYPLSRLLCYIHPILWKGCSLWEASILSTR